MTDAADPHRPLSIEEQLRGRRILTPAEEADAARGAADRARHTERRLTDLMGEEWFRRWLMGVLVEFNTFGNPFGTTPTGAADSPLQTQFLLGMKAAGWRLWEEVDRITPDRAGQMRREGV